MAGKQVSQKWIYVTIFLLFVLQVPTFASTKQLHQNKNARTRNLPNKRGWFYHSLELNYILLNAADLVATFQGLDKGAREVNPVARLFVRNMPLAIVTKAGFTLGVLAALRQVRKEDKRTATITLAVLDILYSAIVTNNILVTVRLSR